MKNACIARWRVYRSQAIPVQREAKGKHVVKPARRLKGLLTGFDQQDLS
jgi:hypothetical protein|tara:strand:+ start:9574 stop:9720 length:147 start_codon:yes stop_codon:yes gene_type:complete